MRDGALRAAGLGCYAFLSLLTALCLTGTVLLWEVGGYGRWGAEPGALYRLLSALLTPYMAAVLVLYRVFWLFPPLFLVLAARSLAQGRKLRRTDRRLSRRCSCLAAVHLLNALTACWTFLQAAMSV